MPVKNVMTKQPTWFNANVIIREVAAKMRKCGIGYQPLINGNKRDVNDTYM